MAFLPLAATTAAEASAAIAAGLSTGSLNLSLHAAAIAPEGAVLVALLVCLLVRPFSALGRFQALAREARGLDASLRALLPSALEEARLVGQQRQLQQLVQRLEAGSGG